ncbi:MAG: antitoxin [Thermoprotei archaeon]|nr:MAG: antitoxin [Thermoprotei archaeon]
MSVVIGIRVPRKLKEELEELGINYAKEVREYLMRRVREERAKRLAREIEEFRSRLRPVRGNLSAELIREDRDA